MAETRCGAPTRGGSPCRFPIDRCPHEAHTASRAAGAGHPPPPPPPPPSEAVRERDLHTLVWWLIEETLAGRITPPEASAVNRMMHTLLELGPTPEADEQALQEVALRGLLMHGVPPRTAEEWKRASEIFDEAALAEFRRWETREADRPGEGARRG